MRIRAFEDERALTHAVAAAIVEVAADALKRRGRFSLALSGGSTPRPVHRLLAGELRDAIDWAHVDVFWGDERFVPPDDPRSNYGLARADLLDHVPCPAANVHPIPTGLASAEDAAAAYEATLRARFNGERPQFDLVALGIGEDCHTASLFPHSAALAERDRLAVAAGREPAADAGTDVPRVTLTLPVLLTAANVFVIAAGARKAPAVMRALAPGTRRVDCPAAALRDADGSVIWWVEKIPGIIYSLE